MSDVTSPSFSRLKQSEMEKPAGVEVRNRSSEKAHRDALGHFNRHLFIHRQYNLLII